MPSGPPARNTICFNGLTDNMTLLQRTLIAARRSKLLPCLLPACITSGPFFKKKKNNRNGLKTVQFVAAADAESYSLDNMLRWKERL